MELVGVTTLPAEVWNKIAAYAGRCILCDEHRNCSTGGLPCCLYCFRCWATITTSLLEDVMHNPCWYHNMPVMPRVRGEYARSGDEGEDWESNASRHSEVSALEDFPF